MNNLGEARACRWVLVRAPDTLLGVKASPVGRSNERSRVVHKDQLQLCRLDLLLSIIGSVKSLSLYGSSRGYGLPGA
jgi:hypothetical protein